MQPTTDSNLATLARITTVLHLAAPNDRNGNPRRAYVAFEGSALRGFWTEGYQGPHAVPPALRDLARVAPRITVAAAELRRWERQAAALSPALCDA